MPHHAFKLPESAFDELMPPRLSRALVDDRDGRLIFVARVFRLWDMATLGFTDRSERAIYKDDYCVEDYDLDSLHIATLLYAEQALPPDAWAQLVRLGARMAQPGHFEFDPDNTPGSLGLTERIDRNIFALLDYLEDHPTDHGDLMHALATSCRQGARFNGDDCYRYQGENHYNALIVALDREQWLKPIAKAVVLFRKAQQVSARA